MIHAITHAALRLDQWLQSRLGRPYNAILSIGLVIEVIHRLSEFPTKVASMPHLAGAALTLVMELALLVHQVGALSHRIDARRAAVAKAAQTGQANAP